MKVNATERRKRRVRVKVYGKTERPRLSVSRSNTGMFAQIIDDDARKTIVGLSTKSLKDKLKGKGKVAAASLLGEEIALLAKKKKVTKVVFDRGEYRYLGRVKAIAEGARKGGLDF
jgi:large subunit ribosomal protein L18